MTTEPDINAAVERVKAKAARLERLAGNMRESGQKTLANERAKSAADLRLLLSALKAEREKVAGLTGERDEARAVAGYPGYVRDLVPMCSDEIEGLAEKWPRVVNTMMAAERDKEAAESRAQSAETLLAEAAGVLEELEPFLDAIVCYASSMDEHDPNRLAFNARTLSAKLKDRQQ
ncbi:hypothetical protein [Phenylobacterium sp. SCN 70-31]|uniref:hypothetical protein n=1 Tax=Phenylobacterium sp. SCN 70-31 TaxID=1660129 RepID=UPI00086C3F0A|nr:hypothetical protein [Phenylobacterium sp. SCN 70-31]ODT87035.1 MAG: hypothetical protein ABS78_13380 [Phenylobacterium sp. SCN 70-31]